MEWMFFGDSLALSVGQAGRDVGSRYHLSPSSI